MSSSGDEWIDFLMARRQARRAAEPGSAAEYVPIAAATREDGRRVPVVKDEVQVTATELQGLRDRGELPQAASERHVDGVPHDCALVQVGDAADARRQLPDGCGTPTYLGVVGGTIKKRPTAEHANARPQPLTADVADDAPIVIVVDTGVTAAMLRDVPEGRDDGWLGRFTIDRDDEDHIDRLDVLEPEGLDLGAGHGTFVAGIIGRVTPAPIVMIRAFDTDGVGSDHAIARAIRRAAAVFEEQSGGRGVLNLSFGVETVSDSAEDQALRAALDALPPEVVVVAAAGNEDTGRPFWPATSKRTIAVAALAADGAPAAWSNHGPWVDFSTLGEGLAAPYVTGRETQGTGDPGDPFDEYPEEFTGPNPFAAWEGTSFAAAQVSGEAANLLLDDPTTTRAAVVAALQGKASGAYLPGYGYPLAIL